MSLLYIFLRTSNIWSFIYSFAFRYVETKSLPQSRCNEKFSQQVYWEDNPSWYSTIFDIFLSCFFVFYHATESYLYSMRQILSLISSLLSRQKPNGFPQLENLGLPCGYTAWFDHRNDKFLYRWVSSAVQVRTKTSR